MSDTPKGSSAPTEGAAPSGGRFRSDPPPEDLVRERDIFIQQFFRRGAQLSEELLGDLERLRSQVHDLERENAQLRQQLASDTAIRDLLRTIEQLEEEKRRLLQEHTRPGQVAPPEFVARLSELEEELANLGTVHVANQQLHASTSVRRALRNLRELLAQFLGAAEYVLLWKADDSGALVPISFEGLTAREARDTPWEDGPAAQAYRDGGLRFERSGDTSQGSLERPAASVPLQVGREVVGVIVIVKTMPQKTRFLPSDEELFKLLGTQAGPAIVHAYLVAQNGKRVPGALAFMDPED
jgi:hypothetical protein